MGSLHLPGMTCPVQLSSIQSIISKSDTVLFFLHNGHMCHVYISINQLYSAVTLQYYRQDLPQTGTKFAVSFRNLNSIVVAYLYARLLGFNPHKIKWYPIFYRIHDYYPATETTPHICKGCVSLSRCMFNSMINYWLVASIAITCVTEELLSFRLYAVFVSYWCLWSFSPFLHDFRVQKGACPFFLNITWSSTYQLVWRKVDSSNNAFHGAASMAVGKLTDDAHYVPGLSTPLRCEFTVPQRSSQSEPITPTYLPDSVFNQIRCGWYATVEENGSQTRIV